MKLNPLYWWREMMGLRVCDTEEQFAAYVKKKLKTPERVAAYISNTVYYDAKEDGYHWYSVGHTLKTKSGNCSEIAGLGVFALRLLGYEAYHLCIYGVDGDGKPAGHAVAAYVYEDGTKAYIEGKVRKSVEPWQTLVPKIRKDWKKTERFHFAGFEGEKVRGFSI